MLPPRYYLFSLLSSDCVLTFAKQGYVFDKNNIAIYEKDGDVVVDVVATYEISGQVVSGSTPISSVLVSCGEYQVYTDDNGNFAITNDELYAEDERFKIVHKYLKECGFILRYHNGKEEITKYSYEPWHIRYVGEKIAKECAYKNIVLEEYYQMKNIMIHLQIKYRQVGLTGGI